MDALFTAPLQQGDTWGFDVHDIVNRDGTAVVSLTNWTAQFTMRLNSDAVIVLQAAGVIGTAVNSAGDTVPAFTWEISKVTTAAIAARIYIGDIQLTDPDGRVSTLSKGLVTVEADNSPAP